jgi:hypothetical protein
VPAKRSKAKKPVAFRLPNDVLTALKSISQKQHISRNKIVELILRDYITKRGNTIVRELLAKEEIDGRDDEHGTEPAAVVEAPIFG